MMHPEQSARQMRKWWRPASAWRFCVIVGSVFLLFAGGGNVRALAQSNYTVFPAVPKTQDTQVGQPTEPKIPLVTLTVHDSTIKWVVNELARQGHVSPIFYGTNDLLATRITVHVVKMPIMDALGTVLKGTGMTAKRTSDGDAVVIRPGKGGSLPEHSRSVGGTVNGWVTDSASKQGLGGAAVNIAGLKLSAVTSDSGHFTIHNVPAGDLVLVIKLFGYRPAERTITVMDSSSISVRIALAPVPTVLSGVVTTAAGKQRKIEVGNDITTLNVDSIRQIAPITSLTDLLETRVPGLTVLHSSGTPGDPSRLRLRGLSSIQGNNDPIVIVDGIRVYSNQSDPRNVNQAGSKYFLGSTGIGTAQVTAPSPVDQIDPASIETVEILKGPSATAIYGSDAAAGVIVITTNHGRAGPTQWSLELGAGVNWNPGAWPINYYRFGTDGVNNINHLPLGNSGSTNGCAWFSRDCHVDSLVTFQALNDPRYSVFGHGSNQEASLTVSGGVPTIMYSVTGSGTGDVGLLHLPTIDQQRYDSLYGQIPGYLVRPDNYTTWGVNGSVTVIPSQKLRVTLNSNYFNSTQQQSSLSAAVNQLEGLYIPQTRQFTEFTAPLVTDAYDREMTNSVTSMGALSLQWQLAHWLPLTMTGGYQSIVRNESSYVPFGICGTAKDSLLNGRCGNSDSAGYYGFGHGESDDKTLNIGTTIPLSRLLNLSLGGNIYSQSTSDVSDVTDNLGPGISIPTEFIGANGVPNSPAYNTFATSTYGWYVQPTLNVSSKFFVTPGFRLDGGSSGSHSPGSLGGLSAFPKIDLSYVAVDRQGKPPLWGLVTLFRPRLALGVAGTQPLPQDKLRLFNVGAYGNPSFGGQGLATTGGSSSGCQPPTQSLDGSTPVPVVCLNALGNDQLRPERTRELEMGADLTFWQNRLSVEYTRYNKTTIDAVYPIPIAPSVAGGWNVQTNIGTVRNTGTELTAQANVLQSKAVGWNIGAQVSNNNNVVVRLNPGQTPICLLRNIVGTTNNPNICNGTRLIAGYPLFGEWSTPILAYSDANHDGVIEANEIRYADSSVYVGQGNPKYQVDLTTGVVLFSGRLSVNATFAYQNGLTQNNVNLCYGGGSTLIPNNPNTSLSTQASIVAAGCTATLGGSLGGGSDIGFIQTVNTFRFNALSVNYNVSRTVSAWFRVPRMTVALQGSNLALHTNYRGLDPDVNAFSTVSAGDETADLGQLPEPRTWRLRLTLGN